MNGRNGPALVLFAAMFASQAAVIAMAPVLDQVASDLGVGTATAGQLRTLSGLAAAVSGFQIPRLVDRVGLRAVLLTATALIAAGSVASAAAPTFALLAAAQMLLGVAIAAVVAAGMTAAADWAGEAERTAVLSWALIGQPAAWIVGMPLVGALGGWSWRLAWLALPFPAALVAVLLLLLRRQETKERPRADVRVRRILSDRPLARWATAEFLFNCGWSGTLVYAGALFRETYDTATTLTGIILGGGACMFVIGNLAGRRLAARQAHQQLVALPLLLTILIASFGGVRTGVWTSTALFATAAFVAGARSLVGSSVGLAVPSQLRPAAMGLRTAAVQVGYVVGAGSAGLALAAGGYGGLGTAMAGFFAAAAVSLVEVHVAVSRVEALADT
jgi:predicted MFS family arabinose efflux permease